MVTGAAGVAALLLVTTPSPTRAQEKSCPSFQACLARAHAQRWTQLAQVVETAASNLAAVRRALDQARAAGDGAKIARLESLLARAQADWEAKKHLAHTLTGLDYRGYLLARAADSEDRVAQAEADLERKTEQFRRLNEALQRQNATEVAAMRQIALEEGHVASNLLWTSLLAGLDGGVLRAQALGAPRGAIDWRGLEPVNARLKRIDVGKEAWEGHYAAAAGKLGQLALEALNHAGRIPPITTALGQVSAIVAVVEVGSGLVDLALVHGEFADAQERQRRSLDLQRTYQLEIHRLGEVIKLSRAERDRTREAIQRQAVFEEQFDRAARKAAP